MMSMVRLIASAPDDENAVFSVILEVRMMERDDNLVVALHADCSERISRG